MSSSGHGLVETLMALPIFEAEWVLWLLIILSVVSVAVMLERLVFYNKRRVPLEEIRKKLSGFLDSGDYDGAATFLSQYDSLETNVVLFGLRDHIKGPDSVTDLLTGALQIEKGRYERFLRILATIGSNAPFIGLFGTVLGIIRAFKDLSANMSEASSSVMAGISEALIATAVGLLVAIPSVVAFNYFRGRVKAVVDNTTLLVGTLLASLKADDVMKDS